MAWRHKIKGTDRSPSTLTKPAGARLSPVAHMFAVCMHYMESWHEDVLNGNLYEPVWEGKLWQTWDISDEDVLSSPLPTHLSYLSFA